MCHQFQNVYGLTDVFKWNGDMKAIGGGFVGKYQFPDFAKQFDP